MFFSTQHSALDYFPGGKFKLEALGINISRDIVEIAKVIVTQNLVDKRALIKWIETLHQHNHNHRFNSIIGIITLASLLNHIMFIPDGHGRWAKLNQVEPKIGHKKSYIDIVPNLSEQMFELGVNTISVWCFKEVNTTHRPKDEVLSFMDYMQEMLDRYLAIAHRLKIKIIRLGSLDVPPADDDIRTAISHLYKKMFTIEQSTASYSNHQLNILLNYDGEDDLLRAIKTLYEQKFDFSQLKRGTLAKFTDLCGQTPPDLIIRNGFHESGGRTGGTFLLETAHTHYYYTSEYCPDMTLATVLNAAAAFSHSDSYHRSQPAVNPKPTDVRAKL